MFGSSKREYRFAVVNFQPSLTIQAAAEPLAVVVEGATGDQKTVVIFGRHPSTMEGVSDVARTVLARLPDLLTEQVQEAVSTGQVDNVLAHLGSANRWNLYISPPESIRTTLSVQAVAGQLFGQHVIAGTPPTSHPRRAEVFVDELPIPARVA